MDTGLIKSDMPATLLIAETEEDLQRMVNRLHTESNSLGLKINKTKTKVM